MPRVPVPPEVDAFLARPNPAVVGTVRPDGSPHTAATWYDWEDGRVLLNMDESRARLDYLRENRSVALTVLAGGDWYRHVSLLGRVASIEEDAGLQDIDRLALRYTGQRYGNRESRRFSAWMEPERWHSWPLADR
ncbi:MAG TPA: TIGR03618 family F420-dependent PPOX class oxidoreductase [Gaiellaceae bacterium]|jgi:PPOX class probable F420-dependent enzyme|nr:TIGR03618 family F420-dependent PPOX class oxidoreductase [Gaiellaceae bacterium]